MVVKSFTVPYLRYYISLFMSAVSSCIFSNLNMSSLGLSRPLSQFNNAVYFLIEAIYLTVFAI